VVIDEALPWLTFPAAVDLSNTIVITPRGEIDLLTSEQQLDVWIAAERGRIAFVDAAAGRLHDVRALRADVRAVLRAYAERRPLPGPSRRRINTLSAAAPAYPLLTTGGDVIIGHASDDAYVNFAATVARSAIDQFVGGEQRLSICTAPSCGLLYPPDNGRQRWCCRACGNRARVARHAARQRAQAPQRVGTRRPVR
jgi:predicted RNA-binding Zn ribbon-like protein